jgi:16S rRNA (adenine1518-N6/adenine1519-N6)-dimethyltransferase
LTVWSAVAVTSTPVPWLAATQTRLKARLAEILRVELGAAPNLRIVEGDALDFDLAAAAREAGRPLVVVGNLPYVVTSPVIFATLAAAAGGQAVDRAIFMVQKEFAQRMLSPPGSRAYGRLSVMVQHAALAALAAAGIEPTRRAEELSVADFARLAQALAHA